MDNPSNDKPESRLPNKAPPPVPPKKSSGVKKQMRYQSFGGPDSSFSKGLGSPPKKAKAPSFPPKKFGFPRGPPPQPRSNTNKIENDSKLPTLISNQELTTQDDNYIRRQRKDSLAEAMAELESERENLLKESQRLLEKKKVLEERRKGPNRKLSNDYESESENDGESVDAETYKRIKSVIMTRQMNPKPLKPRALNSTLRKISALPPISKADFSEEWDKFPNIISVVITREPLDTIRPGECVSIKVKLIHLDDKTEVKIRSASFYRLVSDNGVVFQLKLQEGEVFLLLRLVEGDEDLVLTKPENSVIKNVLQTQEYVRNKNSAMYYRPKAHSVFNTPLGVLLEKNEIDLFIKVMAPASNEANNGEYRILFNTINNLDPNEFSITKKIHVVEQGYRIPKNTFLRELILFLKEMDVRNVSIQEKVRECEKMPVETPTKKIEHHIKSIITQLMVTCPNLFGRQSYSGKTILHYSCALGYTGIVKDLIGKMKTSEINLLDINTRTALFFAVDAGHKGITKTLLEHGATWHNKDARGDTVIDYALRAEHISIVHLLNEVKERHAKQHESKSEPKDTVSDDSKCTLHKALLDDKYEIFTAIISDLKKMKKKKQVKELKDILNATNDDGATALHIAASKGNIKALKELIDLGADINAKDDAESTPLHQAVASQSIECVRVLIESKDIDLESRDSTLQTPLIVSASHNFIEAVKLFVKYEANTETGDERDFTALHHACSYGYLETVLTLLEHGADPNCATLSDGTTPFQLAIQNGHHELIEVLLKYGAVIDSNDSKGLALACANGHNQCVQILLSHNASPDVKDFEHSTPLHKAAANGHLKCIELLLKAGAKIDIVDNEGSTPLHKAAFSGKKDCVSYLLKKKAPVNVQDNYGATPLHNASYRGHRSCVKLLTSNGADVELKDGLGATPIQLCAMNGHISCVKLLKKAGANLNAPDNEGLTALMHAIPYHDLVLTLCQLGADVNIADEDGQTALFHSSIKKYEQSARILIEFNANHEIPNSKGQRVLDISTPEFKNIILDAIKARNEKGDLALEKIWSKAVLLFNEKEVNGINFLVDEGLIQNNPSDIARFLFKENEHLDAQTLGDFLSHKDSGEILKAFVSRLQFDQKQLDIALREYLQFFLLPGEAQQIERVMEAFAHRYVENNPDSFPDADTAFILSFALIMLNTDAHNPSIAKQKKMTRAQFIYNHRGLWGPKHEDPPQEILEMFYDNIVNEPIKFRAKEISEKEGQLKKQGRLGSWQSYWFLLKDQCLFYYRSRSDEEPVGLIPLENVVVKPKKNKFTLVALDGGLIKACKLTKGTIVQGTAHEISIMAEKTEDADSWVEAIRSQISSNPFHEMISKRSEELVEKQRGKGELFGQVGAIVNFKEFYSLALLCESCSKTENQIKKQYGTTAIACVGECRGLRFFLIKDSTYKKQHLIMVGNLWTEQVKKHEIDETFDWKEHFKVDQTIEAILDIIEDHLDRTYAVQLTGHSLGALFSVYLAHTLQQKSFKIIKVVTFAQPNFMTLKDCQSFRTIGLLRIIDILDPVDTFFAGCIHVGRQVTVLNKNFFCYENRLERSASAYGRSQSSPSSLSQKPLTNSAPSSVSSKPSRKDLKNNVNLQKEILKEKRNYKPGASVDSKIQYHSIDHYLKRLKLKLKTDTQHIDAKEKFSYK